MEFKISHSCLSIPTYHAYDRWRRAIATAAGFTYVDTNGVVSEFEQEVDWDSFDDKNFKGEWDNYPDDPLPLLLVHCAYDGRIPSDQCSRLAARLEQLLPKIDSHYIGSTKQFIKGLRAASDAKEDVKYLGSLTIVPKEVTPDRVVKFKQYNDDERFLGYPLISATRRKLLELYPEEREFKPWVFFKRGFTISDAKD